MSHKVVFTYMDEKEVIIYLKDSEIAKFMEDIGKSKVYFDEKTGKGMWIPIDRIRYFQVERESDAGESIKEIPSGDGGTESGEKVVGAAGGENMAEVVPPSPPNEAQKGD